MCIRDRGATVKTAPWRGAGNLPPVLRERYKFAQAELLGLRALLVIDSNPEEQPPATVRKHMDMLQARQQAVSYTHLDVYKRQCLKAQGGLQKLLETLT